MHYIMIQGVFLQLASADDGSPINERPTDARDSGHEVSGLGARLALAGQRDGLGVISDVPIAIFAAHNNKSSPSCIDRESGQLCN